MFINEDRLKECFHNVLYTRKDIRGIKGERFTEKQQKFYSGLDFYLCSEKTLMSSGVTLEFQTTADDITLEYVVGAGYAERDCGRESTIDFYVDGELFHCHKNDLYPDSVGSAAVHFKNNLMKEVTIWLPYSEEIFIRSLSISDGAWFQTIPPRPKKLIFFGDSITQGVGTTLASAGYAMQTAIQLEAYEVLNQGIGSWVFNEGSLDEECEYNADVIITAYGTNDWSQKTKLQYEQDMKNYLDKLIKIYPKAKIVVLSPVWRHDCDKKRYNKYDFNELFGVMENVCLNYKNIVVINGIHFIPKVTNMYADGLHPNDFGSMYYSKSLVKQLKHLLIKP